MSTQNCPRCASNRVRRGYRHTAWWSAMFGRYHLICNNCNWEFVGFAMPGTVPETKHKRKTAVGFPTTKPQNNQIELVPITENLDSSGTGVLSKEEIEILVNNVDQSNEIIHSETNKDAHSDENSEITEITEATVSETIKVVETENTETADATNSEIKETAAPPDSEMTSKQIAPENVEQPNESEMKADIREKISGNSNRVKHKKRVRIRLKK